MLVKTATAKWLSTPISYTVVLQMTGVPPVIPSGPSRWHQYVEAEEDDDGGVSDHGETFTTDRRAFDTVRKRKRWVLYVDLL